jgi:lambda family phage portal protein
MGFLDRLTARPTGQGGYRTGFAAAEVNRLTASLRTETEYINRTLRYQLRALRARARQASQNNPFAARFAQLAVDNIAGPRPFRLQGKVRTARGKFDTAANTKMEEAWLSWGRKGQCEVTGRWSWNTLQRLLVRTLAVDGELLFRKLRGPQYGKHGFQLQIIDIDRLDERHNKALPGGGAIHMGVELDAVGKPVAYHLLKRKPSQWDSGGREIDYERVLAEDIEHIFVPTFAEQNRGVPWMYAALLNLVHIGAFEEAAIIAARVGATQMGFIQSPDGGKTLAESMGKDAKGTPHFDAEPGTFPTLPPGYEMSSWSPAFPDAAVEPFIKAMLRGTAAGLGVAYHNLANDPSDVNYSTAKVFGGDEHEMWMGIQDFVVDHLHTPLHADWLHQQLLLDILPFTLNQMDRFLVVKWQARRWASPDPLKDAKADIELIDNRLRSRTRAISERGDDIEEVFDEQQHEQELAAEKNISLAKPQTSAPAQPAKLDGEEDDDEPENGNAKT